MRGTEPSSADSPSLRNRATPREKVAIKTDGAPDGDHLNSDPLGRYAMADDMRDTEPPRSTMTRRKTTSPFTTAEERAENREKVLRWQHAQKAKGSCRCGKRIAPGSRGRCWECLERCRCYQAARRGKPVKGRRRRGRPMLGSLSERQRLLEREERRREGRRQRQAERRRQRGV